MGRRVRGGAAAEMGGEGSNRYNVQLIPQKGDPPLIAADPQQFKASYNSVVLAAPAPASGNRPRRGPGAKRCTIS